MVRAEINVDGEALLVGRNKDFSAASVYVMENPQGATISLFAKGEDGKLGDIPGANPYTENAVVSYGLEADLVAVVVGHSGVDPIIIESGFHK